MCVKSRGRQVSLLQRDRKKDIEYQDACRKKRNIVEYDYIGGATKDDVKELITFVKELRDVISLANSVDCRLLSVDLGLFQNARSFQHFS